MPYFCHIHNGLYKGIEGVEGCQDEGCVALRAKEIAPVVMFGAVPGGTRAAGAAKVHAKQFDKDMHTYREAVRNGLNPDQVSAKAVETEEKRLYGAIPEHYPLTG